MAIEIEMILRLVLATVLGAIIGYQRERSGKEAGLRTNILICMGSALFTVISLYGFAGSDPSRIAAGIVTGIGFIGAGIILHREGGHVVGLTTAATTWAMAGIGMAAGAGLYLLSAAATVLIFLILLIPHLHHPAE
jgi:putative Mg2+ transporter-C (MgtC) family protein